MNPHRDPGVGAARIEELEAENARLVDLLKFRPKPPSRLVRLATDYQSALEVAAVFIGGGLVMSALAALAKLTYKLVVWL